jgi:3-oxoacyl-[acyl-carrier protein] reductase
MDRFLQSKNAIVTGATRGIGRSIAAALLRAGAGVAIGGRSADGVNQAVTELRSETGGKVIGRHGDVARREDVRKLFEYADTALGKLDVLVNNAGVGAFAPVAEFSEEDWTRLLGTNLTGVFHCCQEGLARFRQSGGGYIINISSLAGKNPFAGGAVYNATKFGLNGLTEAMMLDHRHDDVRVTTIMPGSVATEFARQGSASDWKIQPEDIAEIVLFLLRMPPRTLVSSVDVRPSKPPKR